MLLADPLASLLGVGDPKEALARAGVPGMYTGACVTITGRSEEVHEVW